MKSFLIAAVAALTLAGCGTLANGDASIGGFDTHIKQSTVKLALNDVHKAEASLGSFCMRAANYEALGAAEQAVLASASVGLPAKTVANISNALAKGQIACNGTVLVLTQGGVTQSVSLSH